VAKRRIKGEFYSRNDTGKDRIREEFLDADELASRKSVTATNSTISMNDQKIVFTIMDSCEFIVSIEDLC